MTPEEQNNAMPHSLLFCFQAHLQGDRISFSLCTEPNADKQALRRPHTFQVQLLLAVVGADHQGKMLLLF